MGHKKVYSTFNPGELPLIKSILQDSDIDFFVTNEWSGGIFPHATGMDIMVPEEKVEEAKKIIRDFKDKK
jgi:hypothetical protein